MSFGLDENSYWLDNREPLGITFAPRPKPLSPKMNLLPPSHLMPNGKKVVWEGQQGADMATYVPLYIAVFPAVLFGAVLVGCVKIKVGGGGKGHTKTQGGVEATDVAAHDCANKTCKTPFFSFAGVVGL